MPGCELNDETTEWLLPADRKKDDARKTPTPLPKLQIAVLLFFQLAEPITSQCIYPFINQVRSLLFPPPPFRGLTAAVVGERTRHYGWR